MKKIIIEIDDKQYEDAINDTEWDTLSLGIYLKELVKNGTLLEDELEKVKEKIFNKQDEFIHSNLLSDCNVRYGLEIAEIIIDKEIFKLKGENNDGRRTD